MIDCLEQTVCKRAGLHSGLCLLAMEQSGAMNRERAPATEAFI